MAQFYTLREAAEILGMNPERLKELAKSSKPRPFQDRGNIHFRKDEIDEMARTLGLGSDSEMQMETSPPPKPASKPPSSKSPPPSSGKSPPPSSRRTMHVPADSDLSLVGDEHDAVPIGDDPASHRGGSKPPSSKSKPGSGGKKSSGQAPPSPPPGPAHDSDVRLVADGSDLDFQIQGEEKAKESGPKSPKDAKKRPSKVAPGEKPDSGARILPLDQASDSDVKIIPDDREEHDVVLGKMKSKTPSDSDVRLELTDPPGSKRGQDPFVTEDIELDVEALKREEAKVKRRKPSKSSPEIKLPTSSPFELADEDTGPPAKGPKKGKKPAKKDEATDSSSDFELTPADSADQSSLELGSDELPIPLAKGDDADDAQVVLGEKTGKSAHDSGINLRDPKDSGISLEEGGSEEIEFELSHDPTATPKPAPSTPKPSASGKDSSGEFELSMDDSPVGEEGSSSEFELTLDPGTGEEDSSSEFELSLDPGATTETRSSSQLESDSSPVESDSDSEFELSLDASGELAASDEEGLAAEDKDIFETDFEVPALDDESASEAVALDESDTDMEESDFELDLSDEDLAEEDSGSQVVALDEEGDEAADEDKPVSRKPRKKAAVAPDSEDFDEPLLDLEDVEGEEAGLEEEPVAAGAAAAAPAAPWGWVPATFLSFSFFVMIFVVFMSFEMLNNMWGYHSGGLGARMLLDPLARNVFGEKELP
jgi:hypothetical protein